MSHVNIQRKLKPQQQQQQQKQYSQLYNSTTSIAQFFIGICHI